MTRRTAKVFWAALLVLPPAFVAVTIAAVPAVMAPALEAPLFWLAAGASALNVVLSRALPPRLGARSADRDAVAFSRTIVGLALCEAAAFAPIVAYILSRDARLLGLLALDLAALAALYPSDRRWEALTPGMGGGAPPPWRAR